MSDKKQTSKKQDNPAKPDPEKSADTSAAAAPVKSATPVTEVPIPTTPKIAHGERVTAANAKEQGLDPFVYGKSGSKAAEAEESAE